MRELRTLSFWKGRIVTLQTRKKAHEEVYINVKANYCLPPLIRQHIMLTYKQKLQGLTRALADARTKVYEYEKLLLL